MSRNGIDSPTTPATVAVLHRAGGVVHGLVAEMGSGRPRLTTWRAFDVDEILHIDGWLDDHHVDDVIQVLPASAVICRTCTLPDLEATPLKAALRLQAETLLHDAAPEHRTAMAVLPISAEETNRCGLMVAWPRTDRTQLHETTREVRFIADVAAVAALLNGSRPDDPVLWLDPACGSIALGLSHVNGVALRAARGNAESAEAWRDSVARTLAETALAVGHTGVFTENLVESIKRRMASMPADTGATLLAPDELQAEVRERISVERVDDAWWRTYAVAIGAILARSGALAAMTELRESLPVERPSRLRELASRLSTPDVAIKTTVACLLLAMVAPLAAAKLRLTIVSAKVADIETLQVQVKKTQDQLVMYGELKERSWPMTKLLSDIACNTPSGIDVDQVRVRVDEPAQLAGRAHAEKGKSPQEIVAAMQRKFAEARIFEDVLVQWGDADSFGIYEFTMTATVARPYWRHPYTVDDDYHRWTLGERLYEPGSRPEGSTRRTDVATADLPDEPLAKSNETDSTPNMTGVTDGEQPAKSDETLLVDSTRNEGSRPPNLVDLRGLNGGSNSLGGDADRRSNPSERPATPQSIDIPEPISRAQLDVMSYSEVKEMYFKLAVARTRLNRKLEPEIKERLAREFKMVKEVYNEMTAAQRKSGAGAAS